VLSRIARKQTRTQKNKSVSKTKPFPGAVCFWIASTWRSPRTSRGTRGTSSGKRSPRQAGRAPEARLDIRLETWVRPAGGAFPNPKSRHTVYRAVRDCLNALLVMRVVLCATTVTFTGVLATTIRITYALFADCPRVHHGFPAVQIAQRSTPTLERLKKTDLFRSKSQAAASCITCGRRAFSFCTTTP
jgi:hypothetical protein